MIRSLDQFQATECRTHSSARTVNTSCSTIIPPIAESWRPSWGLLGFAVEKASNGREAFERWSRGDIGLLLTDCQMPGMDGYELARSIRQAESARALERNGLPTAERLPIIAVTANILAEAINECRAVGMDEVLTKPIELARLKRTIDRWLPVARRTQSKAGSSFDDTAIRTLANGDETLAGELLEEYREANDVDLATAARSRLLLRQTP